jgi:hypothetical protein
MVYTKTIAPLMIIFRELGIYLTMVTWASIVLSDCNYKQIMRVNADRRSSLRVLGLVNH